MDPESLCTVLAGSGPGCEVDQKLAATRAQAVSFSTQSPDASCTACEYTRGLLFVLVIVRKTFFRCQWLLTLCGITLANVDSASSTARDRSERVYGQGTKNIVADTETVFFYSR